MSFRYAVIIATAGLASAAAFVPFSTVVRSQAEQGLAAEPWLLLAGYLVAAFAWGLAGAAATRGPVIRPYAAGPLAGLLSAAVSAWLVWLPAISVWALYQLWEAATGQQPPADPAAVIGRSVSDLLHVGILGFWIHLGLGGVMGLVGTVATHGRRSRADRELRMPIFWPLRLWLWSVLFVVGSIVALAQTEFEIIWVRAEGHGRFDPIELLLINGAILGALVAAPAGATALRFGRDALPILRKLALWGYGGLGLAALSLWLAVVPLLAPHAAEPSPIFIAYCLSPCLASLVGALIVRNDPPLRVPRPSDAMSEMMPLLLLTGPLVMGAGLGAVAWATLMGPVIWADALPSLLDRPALAMTLAEVLSLQSLAWIPILAVPLLEGPLIFLPFLLVIRRRAMAQTDVWDTEDDTGTTRVRTDRIRVVLDGGGEG